MHKPDLMYLRCCSRNAKSTVSEKENILYDNPSDTFCGFNETDIEDVHTINSRRQYVLTGETEDGDWFEGFETVEVILHSRVNKQRIRTLSSVTCTKAKIPTGLSNLGNSCYLNSVMQCLNCVAPLVKYFTESVNPRSMQFLGVSAGGLAVALGSAFVQMRAEGGGPVALYAFRKSVGNLYPPFSGCKQKDYREFLMFLLSWLHKDLEGRVNRDANALNHMPKAILNNRTSIISSLFQGEHMQSIVCCNCHHNSISMEVFTILSLSISTNMECTLMSLFHNHYHDGIIDYRCPKCNITGNSTRKTEIQKLPQVLVLHLNRFEYATQANKRQTYVDFPL